MPTERENLLKFEKSPYLLQHQHNPIWWNPWHDEAFLRAKAEKKPIFLSIGYSTCHWCHVMEKESFESEEVANYLNQHFIAIKVDREERPDVDKYFMTAVQLMGIRGGWPLSLFLTPDLKPFFGGTYFPKPSFLKLLENVVYYWNTNPKKLIEDGEEVKTILQKTLAKVEREGEDQFSSLEKAIPWDRLLKGIKSSFDSRYGGFGGAPKFPPTLRLKFMMRLWSHPNQLNIQGLNGQNFSEDLLSMVNQTLMGMFKGGLYDHIGGGFSRYSVDEKWLIPHFEKMLYDNAQLVETYLEAYQITHNPLYRNIVEEVLTYLMRDMTHPEGGFYSAEDADSEGEEGKFYVWTEDELKNILTDEEWKKIKNLYGVTPEGNFEGAYHFNLLEEAFQDGHDNANINEIFSPEIKKIRQKIFQSRKKRIHPHKDDKILTAWNGLMMKGFALAYQVLGKEEYLKAAQQCAFFIKNHLDSEKVLKRSFREGEAKYHAYLDDFAFLIDGLIGLYQTEFEVEWLKWAIDLQERQIRLLWDKNQKAFFYSQDFMNGEMKIFHFEDGSEPNANAVSVFNLLRLHRLTLSEHYKEIGENLLMTFLPMLKKYPEACLEAVMAYDYAKNSQEIVLIGKKDNPEKNKMLSFLRGTFLPYTLLAYEDPTLSEEEGLKQQEIIPITQGKLPQNGEALAYVCQEKTCLPPAKTVRELQQKIKKSEVFSKRENPLLS